MIEISHLSKQIDRIVLTLAAITLASVRSAHARFVSGAKHISVTDAFAELRNAASIAVTAWPGATLRCSGVGNGGSKSPKLSMP